MGGANQVVGSGARAGAGRAEYGSDAKGKILLSCKRELHFQGSQEPLAAPKSCPGDLREPLRARSGVPRSLPGSPELTLGRPRKLLGTISGSILTLRAALGSDFWTKIRARAHLRALHLG